MLNFRISFFVFPHPNCVPSHSWLFETLLSIDPFTVSRACWVIGAEHRVFDAMPQ